MEVWQGGIATSVPCDRAAPSLRRSSEERASSRLAAPRIVYLPPKFKMTERAVMETRGLPCCLSSERYGTRG
jgi:hypothetical protein